MGQLGFHVDSTHCIGCRTCQIACKDKNNLPVGMLFRHVETYEGGKFPDPWAYNLSTTCNHCAEPQCVANCPTGAMFKRAEDGVVLHNKDLCIGCRYCQWSCPYTAIAFVEEEGKVTKCNFCADLLEQKQNPACVDACPMRVLHFGELETLRKQYGGTSDLAVLPDSKITKPSLLVTAKPVAQKKPGGV
jgi:anaerobic dimethyl sulfoxide reductase subunit B (iron-sulfur subunit)